MLPVVSFCIAGVSIILHLAGLNIYAVIPTLFCLILALIALFMPDPKRPVSSRIVPWLAVCLAASPLAVPAVQEIRFRALERKRAVATKPLYEQIDASFAALKPKIEEYYRTVRVFPDVAGSEFLPYIDESGGLKATPPMEGLEAPPDPFAQGAGQRMRWVAIRDEGILLVSAGQDGLNEMPLPGVAMDGPPAHALAGFAQLGIDIRTVTYDPSNGALGLGDVVRFHGRRPYAESMKPLFDAWDLASGRSPYRPSKLKRATDVDPDPQSVRDSRVAAQLLDEGQFLAALGLASRSLQHRHPYQAQWAAEDYAAGRVQGIALYELGAFRAASDALIDYTTEVPNDATAHYYLAASLWRAGNREAAQLHLAAAAQIMPNEPIANQAYAAQQSIESGRDPGFPEPWVTRAK